MKKVAFITPPDGDHGFSLAGVTHYCAEADDLERTLVKALAVRDAGLVIIDERLIGTMPEDRLREIELAWHGILLVLPSPEKPPEEVEDYAARLIRRAIGYHVRLKV